MVISLRIFAILIFTLMVGCSTTHHVNYQYEEVSSLVCTPQNMLAYEYSSLILIAVIDENGETSPCEYNG